MNKRRILIVDNNDELRAILEQALGTLGHEVVVAADRNTALGRNDLTQFDLVISDLTDEDFETAEPVSELQRRCLLTHISLNGSENGSGPDIVKAFKLGAANYVRVPYDREELRDILEHTLSHKLNYVDDPT